MRDVLGPGTTLGYCTNVHAGASLTETIANLERYAIAVKKRVSPTEPMGVGLWLSAKAARDLLAEADALTRFKDWLDEAGLEPFTLNGFPHGDFHGPEVKYRVYEPDWRDPERLRYTLDLARILAVLRPEGAEGSISTLPIGWRASISADSAGPEQAARHLGELAAQLDRIEQEQHRVIHVDLEPEPGCYLDTSSDVVRFFENYLLRNGDSTRVRRHLRVCHDICHAAVMFEDDADAIANYENAGIQIGKVQISSAVRMVGDQLDEADRRRALDQLRSFAEDRYLHQTMIRDGGFHDDLPAALDEPNPDDLQREWRVHFHVPLYLERFGLLETTQERIAACLAALKGHPSVRHYEAETYAWSVLPSELRVADLAEGIANELTWLRERQLAHSAT